MPAYIKNDVRKALNLELAIGEAFDRMPQDSDLQAAYGVSRLRIAALRALLKQVPDDEYLDTGI